MMNSMLRMVFFSIFVILCYCPAQAVTEGDWEALARYEYGQDMKPLLAIDREAMAVMNSPEKRRNFAAQLAALLTDVKTTLPAKQFICQKLQAVGDSDQVPLLAKMLADAETAEMARMALEQIPGEHSAAVLRAGLDKYQGLRRIGLINSLAARQDSASIAALAALADDKDAEVADAAIWAIGRIGGMEAENVLFQKISAAGAPIPQKLAVPCLRCGDKLLVGGNKQGALMIYERLSGLDAPLPIRRAALQGVLDASGDNTLDIVVQWLASEDEIKRLLAAGQLNSIDDEAAIGTLLAQISRLPAAGKILLIQALSAKREKAVLPEVAAAAKSNNPELKRAAIACMATVGDASVVPLLIAELDKNAIYADAARASLEALSGEAVDSAILAAMKNTDDATRGALIEVLSRRKSTLALEAMLTDAQRESPDVHGPAIAALRILATTDEVPALIDLLKNNPQGKHRDDIEKTILIVCGKPDQKTDPAAPVLAVFAEANEEGQCVLLPLLGRFGGVKALEVVTQAINSDKTSVQNAGVRALCNWPDAKVADSLLDLAKNAENQTHRTWALRAYIRVVSLKSERSEFETLAMLRGAMKLAEYDPERQFVIERAAAVRTIETLRWVASYLDDPKLNQAACRTIIELAHHRFLRNPNKAEFAPLLKKSAEITNDPKLAERAQRYMLGL